jgi:hypothetical protein
MFDHVTSKKSFFSNKTFAAYTTFSNTYIKCIFTSSASLLKGVLNVIFDIFNFFHFWYPFLEMISKIRSLIYKVKNRI